MTRRKRTGIIDPHRGDAAPRDIAIAETSMLTPVIPRPVLALAVVYFVASLAHFGHNAEYIAFYPGLPSWLTREKVCLAWLAVTSLGVAGLVLARLALPALALLFLALYGAFGLDGLAHYTLGLCSEHTLASNVTIWAEAVTGLILLLASAVLLARRLECRAFDSSRRG